MSDSSSEVPDEVLDGFGVDASAATVERLGRGHIHRTYVVHGAAEPLVLQRINRAVFPDPQRLAANVGRVLDALQAARTRGDYALEWPRTITDRQGKSVVFSSGEAWRATSFVVGAYAIERADSPQRATDGAQAFGLFCAALAPVDPASLDELIPGFHDLDARLAQLERAVRRDRAGRRESVSAEIDSCRAQSRLAAELRAALTELPRRVCHNDTKINNLLFDESDDHPRAVIDLDTCMPGWWMHDFGDIVRTFCSSEAEDSMRLERVRIRENFFEAVARGFTAPLESHLSAQERESLWLGACAVGLTVAVRFLTDHLDGDRYFAVSRAGHNLDRARNQLTLHRDLVARENDLRPHLSG
jgi:aminoglycoside phosphotransferase (APT) family kinase protein